MTVYEIDRSSGSYGASYRQCTDAERDAAIVEAAALVNVTPEAIAQKLLSGSSVEFGESPNYYYTHKCNRLRIRPAAEQSVALVKCSCGHSVPRAQVMSASMGTSCPGCYDRMS